MNIFRSVSLLAAAVLALGGCDVPLSPASIAGTYVLGSVSGATMPLLLHEDEHSSFWVIADTIRLEKNRTAQQVRATRSVMPQLQRTDSSVFRSTFHYRIRGRVIEFSVVCPPNALCPPPPQLAGRIIGSALFLDDVPTSYAFLRVK